MSPLGRFRWEVVCLATLCFACQCGDRLVGADNWLTVDKQGSGTGTVTSAPAGIDCGSACAEKFLRSETVTLTALAADDSKFIGWSGGGCSGTDTCSVQMSEPKVVTALFELKDPVIVMPTTVQLVVSKQGTGGGVIKADGTPIDCGATCTATFEQGTVVELTALPDATSRFVDWSGPCAGQTTCSLTLTADVHLIGTFDALPVEGDPRLTVTKVGTGHGQVFTVPTGIDCGSTCSALYAPGTEVQVAAVSQSNSLFVGWSGACTGTGLCYVTMDQSKNVTAEFKAPTTGPCTWTHRLGGTGTDRMQSVATDAFGNVIVGGVFQYTADFGNGQSLQSAGKDDGFIAKYDSSGTLLWSKRFGAAGTDGVNNVAVDAQGNVWLAGYFQGTINLGDGNITGQGLQGGDGVLAKYDPNGMLLFSRKVGGAGADTLAGLALDAQGNAFVSGSFEGSITVGSHTLMSKGLTDTLIAKYDAMGNVLWAFGHGSTGIDLGLALAVDKDGDVVQVSTIFMVPFPLPPTPIDFGGGGRSAGGKYDFFVAKFSGATGAHVWSKGFGGPGEDWGWGIATTANKDVVVTGYFQETMPVGAVQITSKGNDDAFLVRLAAADGNTVWARGFGGATPDRARGVTVDAQDNIILAGHLTTTSDFGNGPVSTVGGADIILAKYSPQGGYLTSKHFGGVASWNESWGVATGMCGALVVGEFEETVDFDTGSMVSRAYEDGFVAIGGP
ncbi:MAG: hypothetical protein K1X64_19845 [Myxococcaceae bacterium]|nr:hypothetical protein [Myxococcaceae bacterium]